MGHFYETIEGVGRDRADAFSEALGEFFQENGHRHSERGGTHLLGRRDPLPTEEDGAIDEEDGLPQCYGRLLEKVPPTKWQTTTAHGYSTQRMVPDTDAPQDAWLERWEFRIHTHA